LSKKFAFFGLANKKRLPLSLVISFVSTVQTPFCLLDPRSENPIFLRFAFSMKDDLSFFTKVFEPELFSLIWQKYGSAKV
jgi:hypothetical protein